MDPTRTCIGAEDQEKPRLEMTIYIKRIVKRSPLSSINKVRATLLERGVAVSRMTVSRRLSREFGLKSYKPARKPRLTPAMKAKRLAFAKKHQDWTPAQ